LDTWKREIAIGGILDKMSNFTNDRYLILRKCDYCRRVAKQRVGNTDFCDKHLMYKLLELEDSAEGVVFVKK
jgi:hypothetical protein